MPRGKIVYWVHEMSMPPSAFFVILLLLFFSRVYSLVYSESLKDIYTLVCPCGIYMVCHQRVALVSLQNDSQSAVIFAGLCSKQLKPLVSIRQINRPLLCMDIFFKHTICFWLLPLTVTEFYINAFDKDLIRGNTMKHVNYIVLYQQYCPSRPSFFTKHIT